MDKIFKNGKKLKEINTEIEILDQLIGPHINQLSLINVLWGTCDEDVFNGEWIHTNEAEAALKLLLSDIEHRVRQFRGYLNERSNYIKKEFEEETIEEWFKEYCTAHPDIDSEVSELYQSFKEWLVEKIAGTFMEKEKLEKYIQSRLRLNEQ
jgi:hypothetical protein